MTKRPRENEYFQNLEDELKKKLEEDYNKRVEVIEETWTQKFDQRSVQFGRLTRQNREYIRRIDELEGEKKELETRRDGFELQLKRFEKLRVTEIADSNAYKRQVSILEGERKQKEEKISFLVEKVEKLRGTNEDLRKANEDVIKNNEKYKLQYDNIRKDYEIVVRQLREKKNQSTTNTPKPMRCTKCMRNHKMGERLTKIEEQLAQEKLTIKVLQGENGKLKQTLATKQEENIRIGSLTDMRQHIINDLQSQIAEHKSLLDSSNEEQNHLIKECNDLKLILNNSNNEQKHETEEKDLKLKNQAALIESLTEANKQFQNNLTASKLMNKELGVQCDEAVLNLTNQAALIDSLTDSKKQLESDLETLAKQLEIREQLLKTAYQNVDDSKTEQNRLKIERDDLKQMLENSIKELTQLSEVLRSKIKDQSLQIESQTAESKRFKTEVEQHITHNQKLQQNLNEVNEEVCTKSNEIELLKINQDRLEHDSNRLLLQYNEVRSKGTEQAAQIDSLNSKNCELLSKIEQIQSQSAVEAKKLIDEINQLNEMKSKIGSELIERIHEKEELMKKYNQTCLQFKEKISSLEVNQYQQSKTTNLQIHKLSSSIEKHKEEVQAKQQRIDFLQDQFKRNVDNSKLTISKLTDENKTLQQRVSSFGPIVQQNVELHTTTATLNQRIERLSNTLAYYGHYNV